MSIKNVLGLVPARGGSKALPGKNIANCAGKPLMLWTIDAAHASRFVTHVAVSTDSTSIGSMALDAGAGFVRRPDAISADDSSTEEAVFHALEFMLPIRYDLVAVLQPTSPLRTAEDIDGAIELLISSGADSVTSVYESYAVPFIGVDPPRRQERDPTMFLNGAIYVARVPWLMRSRKLIDDKTEPYVMPHSRSVDIDTAEDLEVATASLLISLKGAA